MKQASRLNEQKPIIVIIGGGVSGALSANHLRRLFAHASIIIVDPHSATGLGLAYSTPSLRHLLNVPAGKISALPDQPDHFLNWLRANYDQNATVDTFAPRAVFGQYIQWIVSETPELEHVRSSVIGCRLQGSGAKLNLSDGRAMKADLVVIATGNFAPARLRGISEATVQNGAYCHDAWSPDTYNALNNTDPVTLIGTGLTAVDVILRLRELGHRGVITAISRRGILPSRHAQYTPVAEPVIPVGTQPSCLTYLQTFRRAVRSGIEWRAAVDSLRPVTNDLWLALPLNEQKRFRRHLQRRWEVVRHRMAPPIADTIDDELAAGTLVIRQDHLHGIEATGSGALVSIRGAKGVSSFETARVINCTGPNMNYRKVDSALLKNLFEQRVVTDEPLGTGFNCARSGALIDADGAPSKVLFNVGPGRLGTLIESIAIPEIRQQAADLAKLLHQSASQYGEAAAA
jgi:hydroxyacylglutathione hydrolase